MEREAYSSESGDLNDIKENKENSSSEDLNFSTASSEDELSKTPDEGEKEVKWLKEAGFSDLLNYYIAGQEPDKDVVDGKMSSLTSAQAAALKRRVDMLNVTLRSRQLDPGTPNVKDIFTHTPNQDVNASSSPSVVDGLVFNRRKKSKKSKLDSYFADRPLVKNKGSAGVADISSGGIQTLSLTHTEPIMLPTTISSVDTTKEMTSLLWEEDSEAQLILQTNEEFDANTNGHQTDLSDSLPNVRVVRDALGLTRIDDLGNRDRIRVRALSLMEVSGLLDRHGINLIDGRRRSGKRKPKENSLFGNSLDMILENDRKKCPNTKTPLLLQQIISYLEKNGLSEEGVLRVSGSASRMKVLRHEIESQFYEGKVTFQDARVTDVAGLLKQFLRELSEPLLTNDYQNGFLSLQSLPELKQQIQALNLLVLALPESHRHSLQLLLSFLGHVVHQQHLNKMNLANVATIMGPALLGVRPTLGVGSPLDLGDLQVADRMCHVVRMLVRYRSLLCCVPSTMVMQLRHGYEQEAQARKLKDAKPSFLGFGKKAKADQKRFSGNVGSSDERVVRVQAPEFTQIGTSLQLNSTTTAGDIVASFSHKTSSETSEFQLPVSADAQYSPRAGAGAGAPSYSAFTNGSCANNTLNILCLYEVGGNIGERCLDNQTNMMALVRVNPQAEWIIRSSNQQPH